jgi:DNA-binding LacI/PurR family transcriptional regulator
MAAIGAIRAALARGIRLPQNFAIASFGDALNRPGFELTPRSWTVTTPLFRRCFSTGTRPD